MGNLKRDGMRMPTVGSNDQLARTTVTGQNVFDKLVPAKLPGQRPPTESPLAKLLVQRQAALRSAQLRSPLKMANEKPFYGRTGALYKPEFGPVVSQVPPPQPVKRSPQTPFPAQAEQAAFSPKQADSIYMNNISDLDPVVRGFLKRAAELGMSAAQIKTAVDKLSDTTAFGPEFIKAANNLKGWITAPFKWMAGRGTAARNATKNFTSGAGDAVKNWQQAARQRANDTPRNWNPFYNSRAAAGGTWEAPDGSSLTRNPSMMRGFTQSRAGQGLGGAAIGGGIGLGLDTAEAVTGYDSGTNWTGTLAGGGLIGGAAMRRNPFYHAGAARHAGAGNSPLWRGIYNSDAMAGLAGYGRGVALGAGADAIEDMAGVDYGDWTTTGGMIGGGLGFGRLGRRFNRSLPNHVAFRGPGRTMANLGAGIDKDKFFLPVNLNTTQALGYGLGMTGLAYPYIKGYAQNQGMQSARSVADSLAQQLGFNDSVSAMASPIGQAIAAYNGGGGLMGGAQGFMRGLVNRPQVVNGVTQLPNQMNSDSVWAALSEYANLIRGGQIPQENQKTLLARMIDTFSQQPSELARQVNTQPQ